MAARALFYLLGAQNRLVVVIRWAFSYAMRRGGAQLIVEQGCRPLPPP